MCNINLNESYICDKFTDISNFEMLPNCPINWVMSKGRVQRGASCLKCLQLFSATSSVVNLGKLITPC